MSDVAFRVRATRAAPPGAAAGHADRRATYGAALAQFDELMHAARVSSPASRPLPLFYALSQAGRAIAAAHGKDRWRLRMHGLGCAQLELQLPDVLVQRQPFASKDGAAIDSFAGVAAATHSVVFEKAATIEALWSSLPEIADLLPACSCSRPLLLVPTRPEGKLVAWHRVDASVVGFDGEPEDLPAHLETGFPTAAGVSLHQPQGLPRPLHQHTDFGPGIAVHWPADAETVQGHLATLDRVAPNGVGFEPRWLRPQVGDVALTPLLTWWSLLLGLSMMARYEPGGWTAALDLDASELAAPLERLLDIAVERVPELVLGGLLDPRNTPQVEDASAAAGNA
jgi:hypothetical protein